MSTLAVYTNPVHPAVLAFTCETGLCHAHSVLPGIVTASDGHTFMVPLSERIEVVLKRRMERHHDA